MNKFIRRLKELRQEKNINQAVVASAVNVSQSVVGDWENGVHEPKASYITALAKYFNVSSDYLLGLDDQPGHIIVEQKAPKPTKEVQELTDLISKLSPIDRAHATGYIRGLLKKQQKT